MAYYRLEPWGEERAELRHGLSCAMYANAHRGKGDKASKPEDFMFYVDPPEEPQPQSTEAQAHVCARIAKAVQAAKK